MNEIGRGGGWENDVAAIVSKVVNGGSKCATGQRHEEAINTLKGQVENMDENIFPRLFTAIEKVKDSINNKLLAIAGVVITELIALVYFLLKG